MFDNELSAADERGISTAGVDTGKGPVDCMMAFRDQTRKGSK
jgi:hypothetical protein